MADLDTVGAAADAVAETRRQLIEAVRGALANGAEVASVARRAGVSRQTIYNWLAGPPELPVAP